MRIAIYVFTENAGNIADAGEGDWSTAIFDRQVDRDIAALRERGDQYEDVSWDDYRPIAIATVPGAHVSEDRLCWGSTGATALDLVGGRYDHDPELTLRWLAETP